MLGEIASVAGCGTSGVAERYLNHIVQLPTQLSSACHYLTDDVEPVEAPHT
jgi:hypothetical protein